MIIQRLGALGDTLFLTPIVREIKRRNLDEFIGISSYYHNLFDNNPYVDAKGRNLCFKKKDEEVVDLDGYYEKQMDNHPVKLYAERILGDSNLESFALEIYETEYDRTVIDNWLADNIDKDKKTIVCHLGNTWVKLHDHVYEEVIGYLTSKYNVILLGRGTEYIPKSTGWINLLGNQYSIQRIKHLISKCDLFFGTDSGLSHICSCTDTTSVVCYSFISPEWRKPLNKGNFVPIVANCATPHCAEQNKIIENGEFRGVSCNYQMCSKDIRSSQIVDAIEKWI